MFIAAYHFLVSSAGTNRGQHEVNLGSTWGQPGVNLGSTLGQYQVNLGSGWGQQQVILGSTGVNLHRPALVNARCATSVLE